MTDGAAGTPPLGRHTRRAIAGLVVTQLIGWGTTFNMPAVLGVQIGRELGMPREIVFAGISVMLLAASPVSGIVGRRIDAGQGRGVMMLGSLLGGIGLMVAALSTGTVSWLLAWVIIGAAMPMMVNIGAFASLAYVAGGSARRAIATMMLFTGFSSTVFWPLGGALDTAFGWRATLAIYGVLHLVICLPIHFAVIRRDPTPQTAAPRTEEHRHQQGILPDADHTTGLVLFGLVMISYGLLGWGLSLHLIDLVEAAGVSNGVAIAIGAIHGPAQIGIRLLDWATGSRIDAIRLGLISLGLMPLAALSLLFVPNPVVASIIFVLLYGIGAGGMSIARSAIPLLLFGTARYGTYLGKLTTPQNLVFAVSPIAFAAMLARGGMPVTAAATLGIALLAVGAMIVLARFCRAAARPPAG